jgi:hypothetical protein
MNKRPNISEALAVITRMALHSKECINLLAEYDRLKLEGNEFLAARMLVDSVEHFYQSLDNIEAVHG